jgi:HK97 family phage major capsid protein
MKHKIQELYNQATELYGQMRVILDTYDGKEWPAEKQAEFDQLSDAFDAKTAEAKRMEKALEHQDLITDLNRPTNALGPGAKPNTAVRTDSEIRRQAKADLRAKLCGNHGNVTMSIKFTEQDAEVVRGEIERKDLARRGIERKDLLAGSDTGGGYLVAPQQLVSQFIQFVDDMVFIRQAATKFQVTTAESLGAAALDTDLEDADWTSELSTGSSSTVQPFGKRELRPYPLAKNIKISKKLLRQNVIDAERVVSQRLAYKFGITEEKAFLVGTGASQPLGVYVASTNGISTARDVTAGSATAIAADDVLEVKHTLKAAYWDRPTTFWLLHRTILKTIRKLKDTTNNYLWSPGLGPGGGITGGLPPTLVDVPYKISEYAPNTITTGLYTMIIGDFSFYWIVDALDFELQVLTELYAATNQNGYIARQEVDGMPVLEEAFVRLKQA